MRSPAKTALCAVVILGFTVLVFRHFWPGWGAPPAVAASVGRSEASVSISSSGVVTGHPEGLLRTGLLAVWMEDPHPLGERVVSLVKDQLTSACVVESVEVLKPPWRMPTNRPGPDLFLRIAVADARGFGFFDRESKAEVRATLGTAPYHSTHYGANGSSLPIVEFMWNAAVHVDSKFAGLRTDGRGALASQLASRIASGVSNELYRLAESSPKLPVLPKEFHGSYQPPPAFAFLREFRAQQICSYADLLTHNRTFWTLQITNAEPQLQGIVPELEAAQWKVVTHTEQPRYVLMANEHARLEIFEDQSEPHASADKPGPSVRQYVVHYSLPFAAAERERATESLFDEATMIETLLAFERSFSPEQRAKFLQRLKKEKPTSAGVCLFLAEHYLHQKETNAALQHVNQARLLTMVAPEPDAYQSRVDDLLKRAAPGQSRPPEISAELFRQTGFQEAAAISGETNVSRAVGQPLVLFGTGIQGPELVALRVDPPRGGTRRYTVIQSAKNRRSTSTTTVSAQQSVSLSDEIALGTNRLRITAALDGSGKNVIWTLRPE